MSRPCKVRKIGCGAHHIGFRPSDASKTPLETVNLTFDELEAIRLADLEGLYQEDAARKMNISRQTFGNIICAARRKVADFIVNSKQLHIDGGNVEVGTCQFICHDCHHAWSFFRTSGKPSECPQCQSNKVGCEKKFNDLQNKQFCRREL